MSRVFGEIRQIAFVIADIDAAMGYWATTLGVGPFFVKREILFKDYRYRGQDCASPIVSIALANSGGVQVELIQQHDENPSIYREFRDSGRTGLQHVASWTTCREFDQKKVELISGGMVVAQECAIPSSGVRLAYFDTELGPDGAVFEIADLLEPGQYERVVNTSKQAENWDGRDPVVEVEE